MKPYRLLSHPLADLDIEASLLWYENARAGLGTEFLKEVQKSYDHISRQPFSYPCLESSIRRTLVRRFPHAIYYSVEGEAVVVLAVLHVSRDPAEWQRRIG